MCVCGPGGGLAGPGCREQFLWSGQAYAHGLRAAAMAQAAVIWGSCVRMESWHLWLGTEERENRRVGEVQWAQRTSYGPSPPFGPPERKSLGDTFPPEGDERGLGTPGTELIHRGPGSPLISSCGPALGWIQECSKE